MGRRCCCGEAPCTECVCLHFQNECASCCYSISFSGFKSTNACLNGLVFNVAWEVDVDPCKWSGSFRNPTSGLTEVIEMEVSKSGDNYLITITLGTLATFSKNLGSTRPRVDDTFTEFTRDSGSEGTCDLVEPKSGDCNTPDICPLCACGMGPIEYEVTISGISDGPSCLCGGMNGTWILDDSDRNCIWISSVVYPCCVCGTSGSGCRWVLKIEQNAFSQYRLRIYVDFCSTSDECWSMEFYTDWQATAYECLSPDHLTLPNYNAYLACPKHCNVSSPTCVVTAL
jgi:hypothetical protein